MEHETNQHKKVIHALYHEDYESFVHRLEEMENVSKEFLGKLLIQVPLPWFVEAEHNKSIQIVEYLLDKGADVNYHDKFSGPLLTNILQHNQVTSHGWESNPFCFFRDPNFNYSISIKAYEACVEIIRTILRFKPDLSIVSTVSGEPTTAFNEALRFYNYEIANMLLEYGGDLTGGIDDIYYDMEFYLSLGSAAKFVKIYQNYHPEFEPVELGWRIHPQFASIKKAMTNLNFSSFVTQLENIQVESDELLNHLFVDIPIPFVDDDFSATIKMVTYLLDRGVDVNTKCSGHTLLYNILQNCVVRSHHYWKNNPMMTGLLLHHKIAKKVYHACLQVVEILVKNNADLSIVYERDGIETVVSNLLKYENYDTAKILLEYGANPTGGNDDVAKDIQKYLSCPDAVEFLKVYQTYVPKFSLIDTQ